MRTLDERQKKHLKIYDNLRHDAKAFKPTASEPENTARQLLDDFLQNNDFKEGLRSVATDYARTDILKTIDTYIPQSPPLGHATALMAAVDRGDDDMLVDLVRKPVTPTYTLADLNKFWHIAANIQKSSPELYTHLAADPRYLDMFEQTVSANEYKGQGIEAIRRDVVKAHEDAQKALGITDFGKFRALDTGMANDVYDLLENGDYEVLGEGFTAEAPQTVFTGLMVKAPLTPAELGPDIHGYYDKIQETKEAPIPQVPDIEIAPLPSPAQTIEDQVKREKSDAVIAAIKVEVPALPSLSDQFSHITNPDIKVSVPDLPPLAGQFNAPAANASFSSLASEDKKYTVQSGDSLWKIAKDQYGLKSYKDIMRAVEHIAKANDLDQGVQANRIDIKRELTLPSKEDITGPVKKLDWVALDADAAKGPKVLANAL